MTQLIPLLQMLNAKERYFLIAQALGNESFALSDAFRCELADRLGVHIPSGAFCAMDYHLDWLHAALHATVCGEQNVHCNTDDYITGNQQDVDLLIAFPADGGVRLVLIEAKASTAWTADQYRSKAIRLTKMFHSDGERWPGVVPHLVLMSPKKPANLRTDDWGDWLLPNNGKPHWIQLKFPSDVVAVTRWNQEKNRPAALGKHWKFVRRPQHAATNTPPGDASSGKTNGNASEAKQPRRDCSDEPL